MKNGLGVAEYDSSGRYIGHRCRICNTMGEHSEMWDSYACMNCKVWLDNPCGCAEGSCPYAGRPEFPETFDTPFGEGLK